MKIKDRILKVLFPPKCIFCRKTLKQDGVCAKCQRSLPRRKNPSVKEGTSFLDEMYAPMYYEGYVRSAVLRYKYGGVKASAIEFAKILLPYIEENLQGKFDCITWVPTSKMRERKRGYDQAQVLAEELGKLLDMPVCGMLRRALNTKPQSRQLTREQRVANTIGVFEVADTSAMDKRILLVDDISTTGSTISECARMLKTAGASKIYGIALAKKRL